MNIREILILLPEAQSILTENGLSCASCHLSAQESLQEGCMRHGLDSEDIDCLVVDLNEILHKKPARPSEICISKEAAIELDRIAKGEQEKDFSFIVTLDEQGLFCMEFYTPDATMLPFSHPDVPTLTIYASLFTLACIGGSTIQFSHGTFSIDLPKDAKKCLCKTNDGECCKEILKS
jgi:hybrid cluster-associated redox disulfide protein